MTKTCTRCQKTKPADEFFRSRAHPSGLTSHCKSCVTEYRKRPEVREKQHQRFRQWVAQPGVKERRTRLRKSPKRRAAKNAYTRIYRQRPQVRAKMRAAQRTEGYRLYRRAYRAKNREKLNLQAREPNRRRYYALTPEQRQTRREYHNRYLKQYLQTNSEARRKKDANLVIHLLRRNGWLTPQPCQRCGHTDHLDAHHPDYDRPLDVIWLCRTHHNELHHPLPTEEADNERRPFKGPRPLPP